MCKVHLTDSARAGLSFNWFRLLVCQQQRIIHFELHFKWTINYTVLINSSGLGYQWSRAKWLLINGFDVIFHRERALACFWNVFIALKFNNNFDMWLLLATELEKQKLFNSRIIALVSCSCVNIMSRSKHGLCCKHPINTLLRLLTLLITELEKSTCIYAAYRC